MCQILYKQKASYIINKNLSYNEALIKIKENNKLAIAHPNMQGFLIYVDNIIYKYNPYSNSSERQPDENIFENNKNNWMLFTP